MRPYIPAIVVIIAFVVLLGAGWMTSSIFQTPQATFMTEADRKLDQAQRMLQEYEGGHPRMLLAIDALESMPAASQPATEPAAPADTQNELTAGQSQELEQQRMTLKDRFTRLGGPEETASPPGLSSRSDLKSLIEKNAGLLDEALKLTEEVISGGVEGPEGLRGDTIAAATQLEAVLQYHKADLKRRQATALQSLAHVQQISLADVLASWRQAHRNVTTLQLELTGSKGGTLELTTPKPVTDETPASGPATTPTKPKTGGGLFSKLRDLLPGNKPAPAPETPAPTEEPTTPAPEPTTPSDSSAVAETPAPAGPVTTIDVAPLAERIKSLEAQGQKTDGEIAEARKRVDQLTDQIKGLRERLDAAKSRAEASEKRMMELEDAGVPAADATALQRFITEYNQQARENRASSREAYALENGVVRNAQPDAEDPTDISRAPLVPAKEGQELTPEVGVVRLEAELRAVQLLLDSRQKLKGLIETQVKDLRQEEKRLQDQLSRTKTWEASLAKSAAEIARSITTTTDSALKNQQEAIDLLSGPAKSAATRAASSARTKAGDISSFYQRNVPTAPSPQVNFISGHAATLAGDVEFALAVVYSQQADVLTTQQHLLADIQAVGIDPATLLKPGEGAASETAAATGTPATQPQAITQAIQTARESALASAEAALKTYQDAANTLQLWVVHTQIASAEYLLSTLTTGDKAQEHRANALREYRLATADRADRPEAKVFRAKMDTLTAAP